MEEENNKTSFFSIFIVLVIIGIIIYFIFKMINNTKQEDVPQEIPVTAEFNKIYDDMVTKDRIFGFYYNKKVTIDDIDASEMINFILTKYIDDNNIYVSNNVSCFSDDNLVFNGEKYNDECKEITKINKTDVDNYIKEKYNTNREFVSNKGQLHTIVPTNYILNNGMYYLGDTYQVGETQRIIRLLNKIEGNDEIIYFFDKAMFCDISHNAICAKTSDLKEELFKIEESDYNSSRKELIVQENIDSEGNKYNSYEFDYNYIFDNYKVPTYKHVFKKENNNYYWISSEVID